MLTPTIKTGEAPCPNDRSHRLSLNELTPRRIRSDGLVFFARCDHCGEVVVPVEAIVWAKATTIS